MTAKFCEQCGAALTPGVHFCEACGAAVASAPGPPATVPTAATATPPKKTRRRGRAPAAADLTGPAPIVYTSAGARVGAAVGDFVNASFAALLKQVLRLLAAVAPYLSLLLGLALVETVQGGPGNPGLLLHTIGAFAGIFGLMARGSVLAALGLVLNCAGLIIMLYGR